MSKSILLKLALAAGIYALASISVALFYNITFFGQAVVPLPSPLALGGCLLYYLAGFNQTPPVAQVTLWILSFVATGLLWLATLHYVAQIFKLKRQWPANSSYASLVLTLPLPWLLWVHSLTENGVSLDALCSAILIRKGLFWNTTGSETSLNVLFFALAAAELSLQVRYLKLHWDCTWLKALMLTSLALIATLVVISIAASILAFGRF